MADPRLFTQEQQTALVENAQMRMDATARAWLGNQKVKSSMFRLDPKEVEETEHKQAS